MRSALFLLMVSVCFVTLIFAADTDDVDNGLNTDNLQVNAGTLTTTKAPTVPAAPPVLAPEIIPPLSAPDEPSAVITTSTSVPSSSATLNQPDPSQQIQLQGQLSTVNQGGPDNERGDNLVQSDKTDIVTTTTTKAATPPADVGPLTDNIDHSLQRQQHSAPLQAPTTTTSEVSPAQQNPTPSKDADAGGQEEKGKKQETTSTTVAEDMATPKAPANADKEINVAQTSVTSTPVPTKGESTSATTLLPNLSNAMQHVDKKDNTIGSSSLFALSTLVTVVMMTLPPVY